MSQQRDRILKAINDAKLTLRELRWEPIGIALEMCGPSGGWWLTTEEESFAAYNVGQLLQQIRNWKDHGLSLNDDEVASILESRKARGGSSCLDCSIPLVTSGELARGYCTECDSL